MEGIPKIESEPRVDPFKEEALALVSTIPNFDEMSYEEKTAALKGLVDELANRSLPNFDFKNNFRIAEEIGKIFLRMKEEERHRTEMAKLGVTA